METWTIQKLLAWMTDHFAGKSLDAPRLSAELILSHVLGCGRIELYTGFDTVVKPEKLAELRQLVKRAAEHEPIAYLVGRTEFYSLPIKVTPDCLIPRPETELLVERAIEFLRQRPGPQHVLDLCTGSGCIAVAIAVNHLEADLIATDISDAALSVAAQNVKTHNIESRVRLLCGDLFAPVIEPLDNIRFDLIVSNPPYVAAPEYESLDPNVKDYEPKHALLAGERGLDVYERIAEQAHQFLKSDAAMILEIGYNQAAEVSELLEQTGCFASIKTQKDCYKNDRIIIAKKTEEPKNET